MLDPTFLSRHCPTLRYVVGLVDLHPVPGVAVAADRSYRRVIVVGQVDLEEPILPAAHIAAAGNVDLVVGVGNPDRDILQVVVVAVVGVLLFGVEAYRSQDEVVGVGVDHRIGIVEEDTVDGFANLAVVEEVAVAGEAAAAVVEEVVAVVVAAAAAAVPGVAAYDTAVAAAAAVVKEEVLAD